MAVPSESSCQEAEKLVRSVYKDEISRKTAADKVALGLHLLGEAREENNDAVTRYVLYRDAIDACSGRDVMHALQGVDEMGWIFAVDRFGMALNQFSAAAGDPSTTPSTAYQAASAALPLAAEAIAAGRYAEAAKLASAAQSLARKSHEPALTAWASAWSDQAHEIEEKSKEISLAASRLKSTPDDPAAYGELGAFYCFWCGFWEKGLPMLAKGSDAALKSIAARDLIAAEADGAAQSGLADQWMLLSNKQTGVAKDAMQRCACKWYRNALPQLSGLTKLTAEKGIGQIVAPQLQHGLTAEIFRSPILVGQVRTRVDPAIDFNWDTTPPDPLVRHEHYSVRWSGWLKVPSPGVYKIIALSDDGMRVWVDGKEVINHWGEGPLSETVTVSLGADPAALCVEYFQDRGQAHMGLGWLIPGANRPRAYRPPRYIMNRSSLPRC